MFRRSLTATWMSSLLALASLALIADPSHADTVVCLVSDFKGQPVEDAKVSLVWDDPETASIETVSDRQGEFRFETTELPFTLVVSAKGLSPKYKRIQSKEELTGIQFRLLPGRKARLKIVDEKDNSIDGVLLRSILWKPDATDLAIRGIQLSLKSDSQGICTIDSMPAGRVTFEFHHDKFHAQQIEIQSGSEIQKIVLQSISDKEIVAALDIQAKDLVGQQTWSFTDDQWSQPNRMRFKLTGPMTGVQRETGFAVALPQTSRWQQGLVEFQGAVAGDFDIEADTEILDWNGEGGSAALMISLLDDKETRYRVCRQGPGQPRIVAHLQWLENGAQRHEFSSIPESSQEGTLRIARRGETTYALWRAASQDDFVVIDKRELNGTTSSEVGVSLQIVALANGQASALWKRLQIRSELLSEQSMRRFVVSVYDYRSNDVRMACSVTPELHSTGSPAWSPDEKWIAYDSLKESVRDSRIMIVSSEGGTPKDIGAGSMPTFSPDGNRIAFSSAAEGLGMMNADGSNRVILKQQGWDLQWSPTGNLSFAVGGQFYLLDRDGNPIKPLMKGDAAKRYSYLNWNSTWSNDGKRIVFKGRRNSDSGNELAVWNMDQPESVTTLVNNYDEDQFDFSWSKDDAIVYFISKSVNDKQSIVEIASDGSGTPAPVPEDIDFPKATSAIWSPSGQRVAITGESRTLPQ